MSIYNMHFYICELHQLIYVYIMYNFYTFILNDFYSWIIIIIEYRFWEFLVPISIYEPGTRFFFKKSLIYILCVTLINFIFINKIYRRSVLPLILATSNLR